MVFPMVFHPIPTKIPIWSLIEPSEPVLVKSIQIDFEASYRNSSEIICKTFDLVLASDPKNAFYDVFVILVKK